MRNISKVVHVKLHTNLMIAKRFFKKMNTLTEHRKKNHPDLQVIMLNLKNLNEVIIQQM